MKVFIVTKGSYSDYDICGVYSTKGKAKKAKKLYDANNDIETWELDAFPKHPEGLYYWRVLMDKEGNTRKFGAFLENASYSKNGNWDWRPYGDDEKRWVSFDVWAKDKTHAVKIANEKRGMLIASGEWTTDWKAWKEMIE